MLSTCITCLVVFFSFIFNFPQFCLCNGEVNALGFGWRRTQQIYAGVCAQQRERDTRHRQLLYLQPLTQESGTSCDFPFLFFGLGIPQVRNYRMVFRIAHLPFTEAHRRKHTLKDYTSRMQNAKMFLAQHMAYATRKINTELQH